MFNSSVSSALCTNFEFDWRFIPDYNIGYFTTAVNLVSTYLYPYQDFTIRNYD